MGSTLNSQVMSLNSADPVLWEALTATIYTKARWILEYAQNAHDVDHNWKLILPTPLHLFTEFYDEGPSMSEDFMLSRGAFTDCGFCTAFSSTKRTDNSMSGGFGIGRLSGPQGTLFICRNEDAIRTYVLVKNENKIPMIVQQAVTPRPADVTIGVTVRVPIEYSQTSQVRADAQRLLRFFEPTPAGYEAPEYIMRGDNWAILKDSRDYGRATIISGGYPITIDVSSVVSYSYYGSNQSDNLNYNLLNNKNLILWAPVGSVDMALNREALRYTEKTKKTILDLLYQLRGEVSDHVTDTINECSTKWEARIALAGMIQTMPMLDNIIKVDDLTYKGEEFDSSNLYHTSYIQLPSTFTAIRNCNRTLRSRRTRNVMEVKWSESHSIAITDNVIFIQEDVDTNIKARLGYDTTSHFYLLPTDATEQEKLLKFLGDPPVVLMSSYPIPPKVKGTAKARVNRPHAIGYWMGGRTDNWSDAAQALPENAVWVPSKNKSP